MPVGTIIHFFFISTYCSFSLALGTIKVIEEVKVAPHSFDYLAGFQEINDTFYATSYPEATLLELQSFNKTWGAQPGRFRENVKDLTHIDTYYVNSSIVLVANQVGVFGSTTILVLNLEDYSIISNLTIRTPNLFYKFLPLNSLPVDTVGGYFQDPSSISKSYVALINFVNGQVSILASIDNALSAPDVQITKDPSSTNSPGILTGYSLITSPPAHFQFFAYDLSSRNMLAQFNISYMSWFRYQVVDTCVVAWLAGPYLIFYNLKSATLSKVAIPEIELSFTPFLLSNQAGVVYAAAPGVDTVKLWMVQYDVYKNEGQLIAKGTVMLSLAFVEFEGINMRVASQTGEVLALVGPAK